MNLSRLFTVQLSMFFVVFSNSDMLSHSGAFVNNFFFFFSAFLSWCVVAFRQRWYSTKSSFVCQELFHFSFQMFQFFATAWLFYQIIRRLSTTFLKKIRTTHISNQSGERGIWTLAPVTRPIPLAGAPLRPLEYFSKVHYLIIWCCSMRSWRVYDNTKYFSVCQSLFFYIFILPWMKF